MSRSIAILAAFTIVGVAQAAQVREERPDVLEAVPAADVKIGGYVGHRLDRNLHGILMHKDENALLDPFRNRGPKQGAWIGEHIGKWLSAASWTYAYSRDEQLLAKLKRVAGGLIATQMQDGYLGTYAEKDRWTSWDVWIHKYNMLGLLDYHEATGDPAALAACRKMGDLLVKTFGPDKRDILKAGEHSGMASASILQPMLMLYRRTGEQRYLDFGKYIVEATEQPNGPKIVSTLLKDASVQHVANAKAYEMLSDIIGMLDLSRLAGDDQVLHGGDRRLRRHHPPSALHHRRLLLRRALQGRGIPAQRRPRRRNLRHHEPDAALSRPAAARRPHAKYADLGREPHLQPPAGLPAPQRRVHLLLHAPVGPQVLLRLPRLLHLQRAAGAGDHPVDVLPAMERAVDDKTVGSW